jgi:ankyrin repeat protein
LSGWVLQFTGLRLLNYSVTVAQLAATMIMAGLRSWVRRNMVRKPDHVDKITEGYELESTAKAISKCEVWNVVSQTFGEPISQKTLATNVLKTRHRLGEISKWPSQWRDLADSVANAIETAMNFVFSDEEITVSMNDIPDWGSIQSQSPLKRFEWKCLVEVAESTTETSRFENITLCIRRQRLEGRQWGRWTTSRREIESIIGLWMLQFNENHHKEEIPLRKTTMSESARNIHVFPFKQAPEQVVKRWIRKQESAPIIVRSQNMATELVTPTQVVGMPISGASIRGSWIGTISQTPLHTMCGQMIFTGFMSALAEQLIESINGDVVLHHGAQGVHYSNSTIGKLVDELVSTGLFNAKEAYPSVVLPLSKAGKLPANNGLFHIVEEMKHLLGHEPALLTLPVPLPPVDISNLFDFARTTATRGQLSPVDTRNQSQDIDQMRDPSEGFDSCLIWLFHLADISSRVYERPQNWDKAREIYLSVLRFCSELPQNSAKVALARERMELFYERASLSSHSIALEEHPEYKPSNTPADDLDAIENGARHASTSICPAMVSMWREKLTAWKEQHEKHQKATTPTAEPDTTLLAATAAGNVLVVAELLADVDKRPPNDTMLNKTDDHERTPLMLSAISGHATIATLLLRAGASANLKDRDGRTALHHAVLEKHGAVVHSLLLWDHVEINSTDEAGNLPAELAKNEKGILDLLKFHGAGQNPWSPLHWCVWRGSLRDVRKLFNHQAYTHLFIYLFIYLIIR